MRLYIIIILLIVTISCKENSVEPQNNSNKFSKQDSLEISSLIIGNGYPYTVIADYKGITFTELSTGLSTTLSGKNGDLIIAMNYPNGSVFSLKQLLNKVDSLRLRIEKLENK